MISFGKKYFKIARTLREAELINGMLTNAEVWYGIKQTEIDELEMVDKLLLRRILGAPESACIESLYLELGVIPIGTIIKARRVIYLHYLVRLDEKEMLSKVFRIQWKYPVKDDWILQVQQDMKDFGIVLNIEEIRGKSPYTFKKYVKIKSKEFALEQLLKIKAKHNKMENLDYTELKLQNYLSNDFITVQEAKNQFKFRRVTKFQANMKNIPSLSITCPFCQVQPDTQQHSVLCHVVRSKVDVRGYYREIFLDDIPVDITRTLMNITRFREKEEKK